MEQKQKSETPVKRGRREFLTMAGVAAAGTGVLAGAGSAQAAEELSKDKGQGYQETAHVRTYYELAKF
ncbi:MAG: formate dehydrogenase [Alphaproteobacteria bacterium]|nr:formate dehydrogenase [Alphaproteobacteria bacterium]MBT4086732.1 formate dehydrogenase [Alphaproteobacteria bacterium]MBT4543158.1 formate dehydrogenase [Alphaproteobacteria bacterium]MBT7747500.1 formate dehydrogenase [Alphaproteobacteria bacterium]